MEKTLKMQQTHPFYKHEPLFPLWHKVAAIRTRPRRIFEDSDQGYCYPIARQPICLHYLVADKGKKIIEKILLQTALKFMHDIAHVEIELINNTSLKIYNNTIELGIPRNVKNDMLFIIIDETFHAYAALDFIEQIKNAKNEELFYYSGTVELKLAMDKFMPIVNPNIRDFFEVICICLGENTLTKELFEMTNYKDLNPFFHEIMMDHMIDEGRHSSFFKKMLSFLWEKADDNSKNEIAQVLPGFILKYLENDLRIEWDRKLLSSLNFLDNEIDIIINDIYPATSNKMLFRTNPVAKNLLDVLNKCSVLSYEPVKEALKVHGMM